MIMELDWGPAACTVLGVQWVGGDPDTSLDLILGSTNETYLSFSSGCVLKPLEAGSVTLLLCHVYMYRFETCDSENEW